MSSPETSIVAMPVQPESTACSARYSSAVMPSEAAFTRIGRSFETTVTSWPSWARCIATARMRRVVVAEPHAGRQHARVGVVELDAQRAALADRDREVEPPVLDAQFVEVTQRLPGEVADLGVVALALELGDHHDGDHDGVLGEAEERPRIAQQHRGVEHVRAQILIDCSPTSSTS